MTAFHWTRIVLGLSGIVGAGFGMAGLFWPAAFHAMSGIELGDNASLLSELRAPSASLMAAGVLVLVSAFFVRWHVAGALLSIAVYASYGAARLLGIALDGLPHSTLVQATVTELLVAMSGAAVLVSAARRA